MKLFLTLSDTTEIMALEICTETVLTCEGALMLIVEPETTFQLLVLLFTQLIKGIRSG